MNKRIREFERASGLEIYGLGAKRDKWEKAISKFAELVAEECAGIAAGSDTPSKDIKEHFAVEESKGWVCPKCGADRTKIACPLGFGAQVDGRCPMTAVAQ